MSYTYQDMNTYGRGDYYPGYYQGDPFLGRLVKKGIRAVAGVASKSGLPVVSPIGSVVKTVLDRPAGTRELPPPPMIAPKMLPPAMGFAQQPVVLPDVPRETPGAVKQPGIRGTIERLLPFGQTGYQPGSMYGAGAPGYHWNKSYSYAKGLPAGSFLVKNRQMNPVNPRALRRAIRRQQNMVSLMRRTLKGSGFSIKRSGLGGKRAVRRRR